MPPAHRLGDLNTGHDACPPVPLSSGSPNVIVNGKQVARIGDPHVVHGCPAHSPHVPHMAAGSSTVMVNGIPVCRIGDAVDCGGAAAEGSPDVIIGG